MSPTAPHSLPGRWRPTPRTRAIALPGVRSPTSFSSGVGVACLTPRRQPKCLAVTGTAGNDRMNDLGEGNNLTSMERDFASGRPIAFCEPHSVLPPTQRESSHNGPTSTSSCSERGMFHP